MRTLTSNIRYGITGFGRFAEKAIAPAITQAENSALVAIQNRSLAKAKDLALAGGIPFPFDSVKDLVAHPDVDAVFIVSPNALHCEETMLAAEAGKHVLCEKPMAMNVAECERMIAACRANNVKLMVGHMVRLSPAVRRIRDLVRSGKVGRVIRAEANFTYDGRLSTRAWLLDMKIAGGGPTFDVGVHCLDTLRYVLDDEVVAVRREFTPDPTAERTESTSQLLLRFSKGTPATIFTSYDSPIRESSIEIHGTEARVSAIDFTVSRRRVDLRIEERTGESLPRIVVESLEVPDLYVEEVTHFSECILNNVELMLTAENALRNQKVLDAAMRAGQ